MGEVSDKDEGTLGVHKVVPADSNTSTGFLVVLIALTTLVTMLGFRVRRRLQPRAITAISSDHGADMCATSPPTGHNNVLELKAQDPIIRVEDVFKLQPAFKSSNHLTVCNATRSGGEDAMGDMQNAAPMQMSEVTAAVPEEVQEGADNTAAVAMGATAATAATTATVLASAAGTACAGGACAVGASAAATAATATAATGASAGIVGGLGTQAAAALGALGLSASLAFAGGSDELSAMAADGVGLQQAFSSEKPCVLEFYSLDCSQCRESSKRLHAIERAHPEINWVMVDTQNEANRVLWEKLGVDEIPHFSFLDGGKTLTRTEIGPISADQAEAGIRSIAPA